MKNNQSVLILNLLLLFLLYSIKAEEAQAKYNGDIYLNSKEKSIESQEMSGEYINEMTEVANVQQTCNASFSTPMAYIEEFNKTAELPTMADKTFMCYIRCIYEKLGIINNWKLNEDKVEEYMWPVTTETIEYCQQQGQRESCPCVRTFSIAKCLSAKAIDDAGKD